jgi:hypothetical protein
MSQYPDGHRVLRKMLQWRNPCNKHFSGVAWLQTRSPGEQIPSISRFRLALHIHVFDYWLLPLSFAYYVLRKFYANTFSPSLTRNLPSATKPPAQDTLHTSHDGTTVDAVEIFSVTCIPSTQFL